MGLDALLARLSGGGAAATAVSPVHTADVTAKPAPPAACTSVTSVTPQDCIPSSEVISHRRLGRFIDDYSLATEFGPSAPHTDAFAEYPLEIAAEPLADVNAQVGRCHRCRHFSLPGHSNGYCGGRTDLDSAYGPRHPLRNLPADRGASCAVWNDS
jgi:hypothetical protein